MDSFDRFVADLIAHESSAPPGTTSPSLVPSIGVGEERILFQLREEILQSAILIAVTAGIANALDKGQPKISPYLLDVYSPTDSPYVRTLLEALDVTEIPLDVSRSIQSFTARNALARRMTQAFGSPAPAASAIPSAVDTEILADAWRRAATAAVEAIDALNVALQGGGTEAKVGSAAMTSTLNLLHLAQAGETVCLDPRGRIAIPGWAERRREQRISLDLEASLIIGKILFRATIRNASPTGIGLEGDVQGEPGAKVVIKLVGDRQLSGRIAWNDGQRLGINLDHRLDANDPLLGRN